MARDVASQIASEMSGETCNNCGNPEWTTIEDGFEVCAFCGELTCHTEI